MTTFHDTRVCAERAVNLVAAARSAEYAGWRNRRARAELLAEAQVYAQLAACADEVPPGVFESMKAATDAALAREQAAQGPVRYWIYSNKERRWWRPNEHGYTTAVDFAGLYTEADARRLVTRGNINPAEFTEEFTDPTHTVAVRVPNLVAIPAPAGWSPIPPEWGRE